MINDHNPTRRAVVAGPVALAAVATLPTASAALTPASETAPAATATITSGPPRWDTATAEVLEKFVGQRFKVRTAENGSVILRLKSVEPVRSGPARPADLPRAEGVSAIFESPDQDALVQLGHQTHIVRHRQLGTAALFMGPVPTLDGGPVIEVILN